MKRYYTFEYIEKHRRMKKYIIKIVAVLFLPALSFMANAQPQWKFHIAFEDATGAKDTIWCIWDTTATFGVDIQFNEQAVSLNYNQFNVFIGNTNGDTTKTQALPHPHSSNDVIVYAINYQYPIMVSWDSSLFHVPGLPLPVGYINRAFINNDYFFAVNNDPPSHVFNMLWDNQVLAPSFSWGAASQFPMGFYIMRDETIGIGENFIENEDISIYSNSTTGVLIKSEKSITLIEVFDLYGNIIKKYSNIYNKQYSFQINDLTNGIYIIQITDNSKNQYHEKIIKTN